MNYEAYEPEIDLKDLFFHLLFRWRFILVAGCIFCVLFGGYKMLKNYSSPAGETKTQEEYAQELALYELELAQYELDQTVYTQDIATYEKWLEQQTDYMEKSVLMQVDPYNKPVATADFFVKLDDSEWELLADNANIDPTDSLLKAYTSNFYANIDWEPIEELTGVDVLYLRELVSVNADYSSNVFTITVVHSDADIAKQLLDEIVEQVSGRCQELMTQVNEHTLTVLSQSLTYMIDNSLANTQKSNADNINTYEQNILNNHTKLQELEEPEAPEAPKTNSVSAGSGVVKYLAAGFVVGILLMAGLYGVIYLLAGVVRGDRELRDRYGYQLLGAFSRPGRTDFLSGIDRLLEKWEGTAAKTADEVIFQRISTNIENLAGNHKEILLTGTVARERLDAVAEKVGSKLESIHLHVAEDMNQNTETLKQLAQCDAIVLVEERNRSKHARIQAEQESIAALSIPVVGYIMF